MNVLIVLFKILKLNTANEICFIWWIFLIREGEGLTLLNTRTAIIYNTTTLMIVKNLNVLVLNNLKKNFSIS